MGSVLAVTIKFEENYNNPESQVEQYMNAAAKYGLTCNGFEVTGLVNYTLNAIMEALRNPEINVIGLHGSSSERKAILVEKMWRRIKRDNLFDVVVMASVGKKPDLRRIQAQVGRKLGVQFEEETVAERAKCVRERIKKEQSILIILDDFWAGIKLDKVGIPFGNCHNGCKIILISRSREHLSNQMNGVMDFSF